MARRIIIIVEDEDGEEISRVDTRLHNEDDMVEKHAGDLEEKMWLMMFECTEYEEEIK